MRENAKLKKMVPSPDSQKSIAFLKNTGKKGPMPLKQIRDCLHATFPKAARAMDLDAHKRERAQIKAGAQLGLRAVSKHWNEGGAMVAAKHATGMSDSGANLLQQVLLKQTVLERAGGVAEAASRNKQQPRGRPRQQQSEEHRKLCVDRVVAWLDKHYSPVAFADEKGGWGARPFESFLPAEGGVHHIGLETTGKTDRAAFLKTTLGDYSHAKKLQSMEIYCTIGPLQGPQLVTSVVSQADGTVRGLLTPETCKHRSRNIKAILTNDPPTQQHPHGRFPADRVVWQRASVSGGQANGVAARSVMVNGAQQRFTLQPVVVSIEHKFANGESEKLGIPLAINPVPKSKLTKQGDAIIEAGLWRKERVRALKFVTSPAGADAHQRCRYASSGSGL